MDGTGPAGFFTPAAGKAFLGEIGQIIAVVQGRFGGCFQLLGTLMQQQAEIHGALVLVPQAGQHPQQLLGALF